MKQNQYVEEEKPVKKVNKKDVKIENLEEKPINSEYISQLTSSREYEKNQSYSQNQNQFLNSPRNEETYKEMENRPITGCTKNFDQILSEQLAR